MKKLLSSLLFAVVTTVFFNNSNQAQAAFNGIKRLEGADRFLTAVEISKEAFSADGSAAVVYLYNSDNPIDALSAVPLTQFDKTQDPAFGVSYQGPLLPVEHGTTITTEIAAEISRVSSLSAGNRVTILGGPNAVSSMVESQLTSQGHVVNRIAGLNRYGTAAEIASMIKSLVAPNVPDIFVVNGESIADALAVSPLAASLTYTTDPSFNNYGDVILLTYKDAVPNESKVYINSQSGGTLTMVGGTSVISKPVAEQLAERHWGDPSNYSRFDGKDRFHTARIIGDRFTDSGSSNMAFGVGLANGLTMADALPAGVLLAQQYMPLLLTSGENINCDTARYVERYELLFDRGYVFGGSAAVSVTAEDQLQSLTNGDTNAANLGCV